MPFDGTVVCAVCDQLRRELLGSRIDKIYQPEAEEIVLTLRSQGRAVRLLLTASASHARLQLTQSKPETPLSPPMFCMLFRKYFGGGKLVALEQENFDRVVRLDFEVRNELGDLCQRRVILEMMGKHSNLILVDETGRIIDAVRHVTPLMSSVRFVQPGLPYTAPCHTHKKNPLTETSPAAFREALAAYPGPVGKALYQAYNGFCSFSAREVLCRADLEERATLDRLSPDDFSRLFDSFSRFLTQLTATPAAPVLYLANDQPLDFSAFPYVCMTGVSQQAFDSFWPLLDLFYQRSDTQDKLRQKSQDLHHLLTTNLDRAHRKEALQLQQLKDTEDREADRICGDLLTANLYRLTPGITTARLENYYETDAPLLEIALDPTLTPSQNAQRYYRRYNKKKRTEEATVQQLQATREEIRYLESVQDALALADCEKDLEDLRLELHETGYLRLRRRSGGKNLAVSRPLSFRTSEGIEVLVGKNNIQNDLLTFKMADPEDLWFHVKDMPGSHVVLRIAGKVPDKDYTNRSLQEAAELAARHSKAAAGSKVPVDYTRRRYVKKPSGAKPGFVIYTHQTTAYI